MYRDHTFTLHTDVHVLAPTISISYCPARVQHAILHWSNIMPSVLAPTIKY